MEQRMFEITLQDGSLEKLYVTASRQAMDAAEIFLKPPTRRPVSASSLAKWGVDADLYDSRTGAVPDVLTLSTIERMKNQILSHAASICAKDCAKGISTRSTAYVTYYDPAVPKEIAEEDIPAEVRRQTDERMRVVQAKMLDIHSEAARRRAMARPSQATGADRWSYDPYGTQATIDPFCTREYLNAVIFQSALPTPEAVPVVVKERPPEVDPMAFTRKLFR